MSADKCKSFRHLGTKGQDVSRNGQNPGHRNGRLHAPTAGVTNDEILGVRHVMASGRRIPVFLSRNDGGSVAARCVLEGGDTPIIDGPNADAALAMLQDAIDGLLLARVSRNGS